MGKNNKRPKLRSVTRTRAKKSVRRPETMGRSFESAGTSAEPEKKSRKLYLLPILLLLLIAICGIGFSLMAKGGEEPAAEVSGGSGEAVTADEIVPPPGIRTSDRGA